MVWGDLVVVSHIANYTELIYTRPHEERVVLEKKRVRKKNIFPSVIECIFNLRLKGAVLGPGCTTCQLYPLPSHGELRAGKCLGSSWLCCRYGQSQAIKYAELGSDPRGREQDCSREGGSDWKDVPSGSERQTLCVTLITLPPS